MSGFLNRISDDRVQGMIERLYFMSLLVHFNVITEDKACALMCAFDDNLLKIASDEGTTDAVAASLAVIGGRLGDVVHKHMHMVTNTTCEHDLP